MTRVVAALDGDGAAVDADSGDEVSGRGGDLAHTQNLTPRVAAVKGGSDGARGGCPCENEPLSVESLDERGAAVGEQAVEDHEGDGHALPYGTAGGDLNVDVHFPAESFTRRIHEREGDSAEPQIVSLRSVPIDRGFVEAMLGRNALRSRLEMPHVPH